MRNNLLQMRLKLLQKKAIQKVTEVTGDFIGNNVTNKITKTSKPSRKKKNRKLLIILD